MPTTMLGLLGVLLCALAVSSEVMPQPDFNITGVAGKWYLIGFATNAEWFVSRKANMKMGVAMLTPTDEGDLEMEYSNPDGSCWTMTHLTQKTDFSGIFKYRSDRWETDNNMRVVDVKYDEFALIQTFKTKAGSSTVLNKLYGRTPDLSQDVLDKFTAFSLEQGILPENIAILPKNGQTPDLSQDILDKFTAFSLEQGILPENIAILPKNGQTPDLSQDILDKFTAFSLEQGILPENIAILKNTLQQCPIIGGWSPVKLVTPEVTKICFEVKPQIEKMAGINFEVFHPYSFRSQIVAGTNYVVKVVVFGVDVCVHAMLFRALPCYGEELTVLRIQYPKTLCDPLVPF